MERETYYKLQADDHNTAVICESLSEVSDNIEFDTNDLHPWDIGKVSYTVTPTLMTEEDFDALPDSKEVSSPNFQSRIGEWLHSCFGDEIAKSEIERCYRFFEEATELVQSLGMDQEKAHDLVKYVYSRPAGDPFQEVGGTMVTLAALCYATGLDMVADGEKEYERISKPEVIEKIRRKHNDKLLRIPASALPGNLGTE